MTYYVIFSLIIFFLILVLEFKTICNYGKKIFIYIVFSCLTTYIFKFLSINFLIIINLFALLLILMLFLFNRFKYKSVVIISNDKKKFIECLNKKYKFYKNISFSKEIKDNLGKVDLIIDEPCGIEILSLPYSNIYVKVDLNNFLYFSKSAIYINDVKYLKLNKMRLSLVNKIIKRLFDIVFSIILLIITLPISIVTLVLILFTSRGNFIYTQDRVGLNNKVFKIYKFRSMYVNSENGKALLATKNDPRITKVGKFIRKYKIDELPQLINVLLGNMSLIGPRPERKEFVDRYIKEIKLYSCRHNVKPGIIGPSHIYGDYYTKINTRILYDLEYIYKYSVIKLKVTILCLTYNHEKYIKKAIESFLVQKVNFKFDILIHDDASTDNTQKILLEYEKKHPKLFNLILQKENQYQKGKNLFPDLIRQARGEYIAICEGDDFWIDEMKLQKQIDVLESNLELSGSGHSVNLVDDDDKILSDKAYNFNLVERKDKIKTINSFGFNNRIAHTCSLVFKKSIFTNMSKEQLADYKDIKAIGDEKLSGIIPATGKFYFFAKKMASYRYEVTKGNSWSYKNKNSNRCLINYEAIRSIENFTKKYYNITNQYKLRKKGLLIKSILTYLKNKTKENKKIVSSVFKEYRKN